VAVQNGTGKVAPEHKRLSRYGTMTLEEIAALPVEDIAAEPAHLYLWVPNALLPQGLAVMEAWGFRYISNIVWHKVRKDGGSDGRGVGFCFRNVTELLLLKRLPCRAPATRLFTHWQASRGRGRAWIYCMSFGLWLSRRTPRSRWSR
jgi:hypothetical protein